MEAPTITFMISQVIVSVKVDRVDMVVEAGYIIIWCDILNDN